MYLVKLDCTNFALRSRCSSRPKQISSLIKTTRQASGEDHRSIRHSGTSGYQLYVQKWIKQFFTHFRFTNSKKDTSIPRGWCRPGGWGCWGWGRRALSVASCWPNCPVFCSWHTAAVSSAPASPPVPPRTRARPPQLQGARQGARQEARGRWRSWCGRGPERGVHQHGPARGGGAEGLTNSLARHQRQGLWYCWHNLPLWRNGEAS